MRSKTFDPTKYGVTIDEWDRLADTQRHHLYYRYKRSEYLRLNPERDRENYRATAEIRRAVARRGYYKNHEQQLARFRARRAKASSLKAAFDTPDAIYRQVIRLLPSSLPREARDDITGNILLAVLEGKLLVRDLRRRASEFVRAYNRDNDPYKTRSLNETMPGGRQERIDTLTVEDQPW